MLRTATSLLSGSTGVTALRRPILSAGPGTLSLSSGLRARTLSSKRISGNDAQLKPAVTNSSTWNARRTGLAKASPTVSLRHLTSTAAGRTSATVVNSPTYDPLNRPISVEAQEILKDPSMGAGYLFADSIFPIKLGFWDIRSWLARVEEEALLERIKSAMPSDEEVGHEFRVLGVEARMKDGGAFISFAYRKKLAEDRDDALIEIEKNLKQKIKKVYNPSTIFFFTAPCIHVVRGKPFREDMNRFPAPKIRVELQGGDVPEERIWETLRTYGKIHSLEKKPNEAIVVFSRMRGATAARNCAHGMKLPEGPVLSIHYERVVRSKAFFDWASNHPRIVFPLLLTLLGTITYVVFDPIRAWFVEQKIERTFQLERYQLYNWVKEKTDQLLGDQKVKDEQDIWRERRQAAREISALLRETPTTFITIAGPKGSGKGQVLANALQGDVLSLEIDCEQIAKAGKADSALITALATQTGYWPIFSWLNSLNNLIDLAAVGLIGSKAGFAAPVDAQLRQLLTVVSTALARTNVREQKKAAKRAKKVGAAVNTSDGSQGEEVQASEPSAAVMAAFESPSQETSEKEKPADGKSGITGTLGQGVSSITSGVTKLKSAVLGGEGEAKKEAEKQALIEKEKAAAKRTQDELLAEKGLSSEVAPEGARKIPVVVIKSFHHKGVKNPVLFTALAEWAAELVNNGVAHVIFVSDNPVGMSKELTKALPNRPFEGVLLADADELRARKIVASKLRELVGPITEDQESVSEEIQNKRRQLHDDERYGGLNKDTAQWVDKLGGRLTDLETLIQKVSLGQTVQSAVSDIIARTVIELRKNAFGDDAEDAKSLPWSRGQAWTIVSQLADKDEINYYGLLHDSFKGDETALKAMEQAELISVRHVEGRPSIIRAGRPVFLEAMKHLVADKVFSDTQRLLSSESSIASNEAIVREVERELKDLSEVYSVRSSDVGKARAVFLLEKMADAQQKIEKLEKDAAELKKRLLTEKETVG